MTNQETQGITNDVDPASVDRVVMQLQRLADALEILAGTRKAPQPQKPVLQYEAVLAKVSRKFGDKREMFAKIVHDNATKHPAEISDLLKAAGILAPSTYWKDVAILRQMAQSE